MGPESDWVFGAFRLDAVGRQLWRGTTAVPLRPKLFAALQYLVEHAGRLITREELLRAVWSRTHVDETLLRGTMRDLRAALDDDAEAPLFIETIPHQGYRFLAAVRREARLRATAEALAPTDARSRGLIERERERALLDRCLDRTLNRQRQIVFVTGEPGIGKTMLVDAFVEALPNRHGVLVGRGQCVEQYGGSEAYLPVLEAIGQLCRHRPGKRVLGILNQYAPTWLVQLPALLTDSELDALQRKTQGAGRDRMLREMAEALEALSVEMPVTLVFEDLHWSDHSTLDLLGVLSRRREPARLLVLGTYRPTDVIVSGHPLRALTQELQTRGLCEEVPLGFLSEPAIATYLSDRFGATSEDTAFRSLAHVMYRRTDGNPLFMVNVADDLVARGVIAVYDGAWHVQGEGEQLGAGVPDGLKPLIDRQFERLPPEDQRLLEAASIAGRVFSAASVAAALEATPDDIDERCENLGRRAVFIAEAVGHPAGHYTFLHDLYQRSLYDQLSTSRRARLHRRVAEFEAQAPADQVRERAAQLAVHFERGGDPFGAIPHLLQAARNALERRVFQEAIDLLQHALVLLAPLQESRARDELELSVHMLMSQPFVMARGSGSPEVAAAVNRARELSQRMDQDPARLPALLAMARLHVVRAELREAAALVEPILALSRQASDPLPLIADSVVTLISCFQGALTTARARAACVGAAYDMARHGSIALTYSDDPGVMCLGLSAWALWGLGFPDQATAKAAAAIELARRLRIPYCESMAWMWACWVNLLSRNLPAAETSLDALDALAMRHDLRQFMAERSVTRGWLLVQQGGLRAAVDLLERGLVEQADSGTRVFAPWIMSSLAEALAGGGQAQRARGVADAAISIARTTGDLFGLMQALTVKGQVCETSADATAAVACFEEAGALARQCAARSMELRAATRLARLRQRQGKVTEARELLSEVYGWFTEGFDAPDLQDARALLVSLEGSAPRAQPKATRARR